jgi:hypothetical protein
MALEKTIPCLEAGAVDDSGAEHYRFECFLRITDEFIVQLDFMVVDLKHHGYNWAKKCCYAILGHEIIISPCNSWQQGNASTM